MMKPDCIYQVECEPDEGFSLSLTDAAVAGGEPPRPWRGYRIRYRRQGARRWRSFLLEIDEQPDIGTIQRVCAQHERTAYL